MVNFETKHLIIGGGIIGCSIAYHLTRNGEKGMEGFIRVGYANNPEVLRAGLSRVSEYLKNI